MDKEVKEPSESAIVYEAARAAGVPLEKLRQWRFSRVPLSAIHFDDEEGKNTISLSAGEKEANTVVFGQYRLKAQEKQQLTPAIWGFSLGKWSTDGDMRVTDKTINRLVQDSQCKPAGKDSKASQFSDNQDLSPSAGEQRGEYRLYLVLGKKAPAPNNNKINSDVSPELNMQFKKSLKIIL